MFNTKTTALFLLLTLGIIWGTGYSIARFATINGVPPLGYSFWQALGPALLISLLSKTRNSTLTISVPHLRYYLIAGLTGIVIPNTNMYLAAPHLPTGILAVVVNIVPVIAYPLALLSRTESFNILRLCGVFSAMAGILLILLPKTSLPSPDMIPWVLSSLITPISFAFCAVYIARHRPDHSDALSLSGGTLIAASMILLPFVLALHHFYTPHFPLTMPDFVILLEIILSSMGYILFFQLIKVAGPIYYSLVDTIVALTGLFWGYVIFGERLNTWTAPAVALILIALILVTYAPAIPRRVIPRSAFCPQDDTQDRDTDKIMIN